VSVANGASSISSSDRDTLVIDGYRPIYDTEQLSALLARAMQEYNKVEPVLQMALYRVRIYRVSVMFFEVHLHQLCASLFPVLGRFGSYCGLVRLLSNYRFELPYDDLF